MKAALILATLLSAALAQEPITWTRTEYPQIPFSMELPSGGDLRTHDVSVVHKNGPGKAYGLQVTLDGLENIVRVQYSLDWDDNQTGFQYYTNYPFEQRDKLGQRWGKVETKSLDGFVVREFGQKLGPSSAFPEPRWNIYTVVEMGPRRFMTVHLSSLETSMPRYSGLYKRIRDSLRYVRPRAKRR